MDCYGIVEGLWRAVKGLRRDCEGFGLFDEGLICKRDWLHSPSDKGRPDYLCGAVGDYLCSLRECTKIGRFGSGIHLFGQPVSIAVPCQFLFGIPYCTQRPTLVDAKDAAPTAPALSDDDDDDDDDERRLAKVERSRRRATPSEFRRHRRAKPSKARRHQSSQIS